MHTLTECSLTRDQRNVLKQELDRDGFSILPFRLDADFNQRLCAAIDRLAEQERERSGKPAIKINNCVDKDPALMELLTYRPALQLTYDVFGSMFCLNQSNLTHRPCSDTDELDFLNGAGWHADGPGAFGFPQVNGHAGLHYVKFGYFLNDLTAGNGGALQVVRGSHLRAEAEIRTKDFNIQNYKQDLVEFNCEAGTVVAFSQALWHAAPPNRSPHPRKNIYFSYCPTWMRPFDRELPQMEDLAGINDPVARFLLNEPRPAQDWWLPSDETRAILGAYAD